MANYKNLHHLAKAGYHLQMVKEDLEEIHRESKALDIRERLLIDIEFLRGLMNGIASIMKDNIKGK